MALNPNRVCGFKTRKNQTLTAACRFEPGASSVNRGLTVKHRRCVRQENVSGANDMKGVSSACEAGDRIMPGVERASALHPRLYSVSRICGLGFRHTR